MEWLILDTSYFIFEQVLRTLEELKTRNVTGENYRMALEKSISDNFKQVASITSSGNGNKPIGTQKQSRGKNSSFQQMDNASHFILRAAYCKTEDLRRWFITQETHLFKYQLEKMADTTKGASALSAFLVQNGLQYDLVSDEEKERLKSKLLLIPSMGDSSKGATLPSASEISSIPYYKIPFHEATELVARRQCFLSRGYAYVPVRKIVSIITARFRSQLSKSLAHAARMFAQVTSEYAPLAPILNTMNAQDTNSYNTNDHQMGDDHALTSQNVHAFASSMPLCMSQLHAGLGQDSKLRHHGRLQYGLFLKGAGMSMEESLLFFQKEFTRIMTSEKFQKDYSYNIRHMYGKEGKRTNYTPYSCTKIILGTPPSAGDHHGCPYKHYDDDHLSALLGKLKIGSASERSEIINLKRKSHFNLACQKHFEVTHPNAVSSQDVSLNGVGEHPNAWYASSVAYNEAKSGAKVANDSNTEK